MTISLRLLALSFCGAVLPAMPTAAQSALTCSASISDVVFGEVYLRDALAQQTVGDVSISCSGGLPGAEVRACLFLGNGSGGGTTSARYMRRSDGEGLSYQLYSGGHGGTPWTEVEFAVPLDGQGAGSISSAVYADILSSGSDIKGGSYSSMYSGSGDISLNYDEGGCTGGGVSIPSPFEVSATVSPSCTVSVGNMDFGDVGGQLASGAEATAPLNVTCTGNAPYSITLGPGTGTGVTGPEARQMSNETSSLTYGLYKGAGGSQPWGWTSGQDDLSSRGTGMTQGFTVYGRIHGGQEATIGEYTDSVVVTVHY